jgi:hypothetical protein
MVSITSHGIFKRIPLTTFWQPIGDNLENELIYDVKETTDGAFYVATASGIFKSQGDLISWKKVYEKGWVKSMALIEGNLVASSIQGIIRSVDGNHWNSVVSEADALYNISVINHQLVANREAIEWNMTHQDNSYLNKANNNSILSSVDGGKTWQAMNTNGISSKIVYDVIQAGNYLFASHAEGISRSADGGKTWTTIPFKISKYETQKIKLIKAENSILAFVINTGC